MGTEENDNSLLDFTREHYFIIEKIKWLCENEKSDRYEEEYEQFIALFKKKV